MHEAVTAAAPCRILTVGWSREQIIRLWSGGGLEQGIQYSHMPHPRIAASDWPAVPATPELHFFRPDSRCPPMPAPDRDLLASLEGEGVPTVHNMILGDRVVSRLPYAEALAYATFLARRLFAVYEAARPNAVISGFDALHAGLALAVARHMAIPWYALNFSVIPAGLACFCDRLTPAARVHLPAGPELENPKVLARSALEKFESRDLRAPAFVTPGRRTLIDSVRRMPARLVTARRILGDRSRRDFLRYTDLPARFDVLSALARVRQIAKAHRVAQTLEALTVPPSGPFVLFGLHRQPEASIDVWAPFFSNQMWIVELLSRSLPATHELLVKIHKSDAANYTRSQLRRVCSLPGVRLVSAFADTRAFIERADLVVAIQGTIGLESALLGKPVIMLGESPVTIFPSVEPVGKITELPALVRRQLGIRRPDRESIIDAFAEYLAPFRPASHNDWTRPAGAGEAERFAALFAALRGHVTR